ncbi:MAG: MATE family efflux transporter [Flavobacteriales bacterium]|nr:MATE family efflux transporter [Flavobacteriales bacterium]
MLNTYSYKKIWQIAFPIIISGIAQNVVNVTDTAFLGQVSNTAMGAAGNAGIFYFILAITGMGFSLGAQIVIARRNGEGNLLEIGKIVDHIFYFIIPLAILLFGLVQFFSANFFESLVRSESILKHSIDFINVRIWGILFAFLNFTFNAFYVGITRTKILSISTIIMMLVNVILDYTLIFGNFGMPEMGIKGAALASVIAEGSSFLFIFIYTIKKVDINKYNLFGFQKFELKTMKRLINVSLPVMLQNFIAIGSWFIFFIIIEKMGEKELAISHIVRSIYMVMMIPLFGLSSATNTLVSNLIGEGKQNEVLGIIKKIVIMSFGFTFILSLICFFFPVWIIGFYTNDQQLLVETIDSLRIVNLTMFFFCVSSILFNGVTGTGNTRTSFVIEMLNITIYLISAYYIAIEMKASLSIVWASEFIYFGFLGIFSYWYLKYGNWKKKRI